MTPSTFVMIDCASSAAAITCTSGSRSTNCWATVDGSEGSRAVCLSWDARDDHTDDAHPFFFTRCKVTEQDAIARNALRVNGRRRLLCVGAVRSFVAQLCNVLLGREGDPDARGLCRCVIAA